MNTVTLAPPKKKKYVWEGPGKDLIGDYFTAHKSAFIGICGNGSEEKLFLVSYCGIIQADSPKSTWSFGPWDVKVIRFVDVNITIIGEGKNE